jgi:hypothetical protein
MKNIDDAEFQRVEEMTIQMLVVNVTQDHALIESRGYCLSSSLIIEPAIGHTGDHVLLHLALNAKENYFTGAVSYHPLRPIHAEFQYGSPDDPDQAIASRRRVVELEPRETH